MKALLLAAGLGTRLRPITNTIPKCLVPINGKPLLEYWIENLSKVGIKEILVNTSYLSNKVENYINDSQYKDIVTLVHEEELLNTGGTLLANKSFFMNKKSDNNEPFMLIHADNFTICDFTAFIYSHKNRPKNCDITMMLFKSDNPSSCGIVELDKNNVVQKFHEKVKNPPSNLANGAVYICEASIFNFLESLNKKDIDFSNDVLPHFMGKINTYLNDVYHRDIGTIESYALAQIEGIKYV
ncbi:MAG: nucleotidyltransferase family protein [Arcobacteraceae bacterium]|nr:nucleotidyltransferase family protein [Arcobacteraceae bacterium]